MNTLHSAGCQLYNLLVLLQLESSVSDFIHGNCVLDGDKSNAPAQRIGCTCVHNTGYMFEQNTYQFSQVSEDTENFKFMKI